MPGRVCYQFCLESNHKGATIDITPASSFSSFALNPITRVLQFSAFASANSFSFALNPITRVLQSGAADVAQLLVLP